MGMLDALYFHGARLLSVERIQKNECWGSGSLRI